MWLLTSGVGERSKPWEVPPPAFPLPEFSADSLGGCISNTDVLGYPHLPIGHWAAGTFRGELEGSPSRAFRAECWRRPACCRCSTPSPQPHTKTRAEPPAFPVRPQTEKSSRGAGRTKKGCGGKGLTLFFRWLDVTMNRTHNSAPGFCVIKLGRLVLATLCFVCLSARVSYCCPSSIT